jgi:uracil phosphoribosyltransferase
MIDIPPHHESFFPNDPRVCTYEASPLIAALVAEIRADRTGGSHLRQKFHYLAELMGRNWLAERGETIRPTVIGIPRSGVPMSEGLHQFFFSQPLIQANLGFHRNMQISPLTLPRTIDGNEFIVVDSVVLTGQTLLEVLDCLRTQRSSAEVTIFAALASPEGVRRVIDRFPNVQFQIAMMESHTCSHWNPHTYRLTKTMPNMGNFGELVSRP